MIFGALITQINYLISGGVGPTPPPGTDFMITEISSSLMIDESGNLMITE